jgi:hypothetical protein
LGPQAASSMLRTVSAATKRKMLVFILVSSWKTGKLDVRYQGDL